MKKMMFAVFIAVITMAFTTAMAAKGGEVYIVGDGNGWTNLGHIDYKTWAATKHFQVGDSIVFRYAKKFHNVVRVSYKNYKTCNATNSYNTYNSGNDIFTIRYPGHYFFICSTPDHCESGQKVDIRVLPTPAPPVETPAPIEPLPFPYPQPYIPSPAPVTPSPAPTKATPVPAPIPVTQSPPPTKVTQVPAPSPVTPSPAPSPAPTPVSPAPAGPAKAPSTPEDAPDADAAPEPAAAKSPAKQLETTLWATLMIVLCYVM
ncbi:mavicyanin [Artemisia annua]|uniref:Mavicyanin n=1 Tax=Artemisia annua TaxID=35608 RepID=A0A2U1LN39_ARTAN|nr:mavicyanin [Artemisia annua]